jgi:long-chain acyl-CoA synthetase
MSSPKPWFASYPPELPTHLEYPLVPVTHFLEQSATDFPLNNALYFFGKQITYHELLSMSYQFAIMSLERSCAKRLSARFFVDNCRKRRSRKANFNRKNLLNSKYL